MELSDIKANEAGKLKEHKNKYVVEQPDVVRKKRGFLKRFIDEVKPDEEESITNYIVFKVFIPSILNMAHDALSSAVDIMFTGTVRRDTKNKSTWGGRSIDTDYGRIYGRKPASPDPDAGYFRTSLVRNRGTDYREFLIFRSMRTATEVWDSMQAYIDDEGYVSVDDFFTIIDREDERGWNDGSVGWTSLIGTTIKPLRNGLYELVLPRLERL